MYSGAIELHTAFHVLQWVDVDLRKDTTANDVKSEMLYVFYI